MNNTERAVVAWIDQELRDSTSPAARAVLLDLKQELRNGSYMRATPRRGRPTVRVQEK